MMGEEIRLPHERLRHGQRRGQEIARRCEQLYRCLPGGEQQQKPEGGETKLHVRGAARIRRESTVPGLENPSKEQTWAIS